MNQLELLDAPILGYCWWLDLNVVRDWLWRQPFGWSGSPERPELYVSQFSVDTLLEIGAWKQVPYVIREDLF